MEILGVFEGGGARGFAHVGALRATEVRDLKFKAVAGTSIGAVIATLVAAGYKSEELYRHPKGQEEAGLLSGDLEQLLMDPREYKRAKRVLDHLKVVIPRGEKAKTSCRGRIARFIGESFHLSWWTAIAAVNISFLAYLVHWRVLRDLWKTSGAVGTAAFRVWLNQNLAEKLGLQPGTVVTFRDLPIPLRVIATDLTSCNIRIFGTDSTPTMEVAEAVSASISFPFFFKPVLIEKCLFVDGGLTSNAPAWVLDDIRDDSDKSIPTFNFKLLDPPEQILSSNWPEKNRVPILAFFQRLVPSSLNSRAVLESRKIDDFHLIELRSTVRTLDFDLIRERRGELVDLGARGVTEYYLKNIGPKSREVMSRALRAYLDFVREAVVVSGAIRAYLIQPTDPTNARVVYSAGFEQDADDVLSFKLKSFTQAKVLEIREPILMRCDEISMHERSSPATKYVHALRPPDVRCVYTVPIFANPDNWKRQDPLDRDVPIAALCLHFSELQDLLLLDPKVEDALAAMAQAVGSYWTDRPAVDSSEEEILEEPPAPDWTKLAVSGFYISDRKTRAPLDDDLRDKLQNANRLTGNY